MWSGAIKYVRQSRNVRLATARTVAMVLVTGCTSEDSDRGVPDDCVRTGQAYGEFPIVDSLYEAGAVTPQDAKAEAEAVGVSRSDSELLFDGPEKDFPSMSQVRQDQHLI
jgi:hypothetical protein